jgi:hypothetical protein
MKRKIIGICAILLVAVISSGAVWVYQTDKVNRVDESVSRFAVEYRVQPENIDGKLLSITIQLKPEKLSPQKMMYLDNGSVNTSKPTCTDDEGKKVSVNDINGVWEIGPITDRTAYVNFCYNVKLGENSGEDSQVNGDLYSDLLVFQGKNVLMIPWFDSTNIEYTEKYITNVKFNMTGNQKWNAIIPFAKTNSEEKTFQIPAPTWYDFYDISNSSYCFGSFEPLKASSEGQELTFYLDQAVKTNANTNDLNLVMSFCSYYTKVFGKGLGNYPVVLLRNSDEGNTILGGVSGKNMALSLGMSDPDACQTMSRTLYHAFFDSMITARNLRYQPNDWLYDGLANYYVDASADAISSQLKQIYDIEPQDNMNSKYMRYLYFSLKDPNMMAVSPDMEGSMTSAQQEFYYNTKVPLILHTIEKASSQKGEENSLIHYLMAQKPHENIDITKMMNNLLGKNEPVLRQYFSGSSFIPNYWGFSGASMDDNQMIEALAAYENKLADLSQGQNNSDPDDTIRLINKNVLEKEIKSRKLSFGSKEIEGIVKNYSDTLYLLLMQNSLQANICGIQDPGALGTQDKLQTAENTKKWSDYVKTVGYAV